MTQRNSFLKSTVFVTTGRALMLGFGIILTPILVRVLTKEEYGVFAAVFALFEIIKLVSYGGLFDSVRKKVAETATERGQTDVVSTGYALSVVYGIAGTGVAYLIAVTLFGSPQSQLLILFAASLVGMNLYQVSRSAFHGRQQEQFAMVLDVVQRLVYLVAGAGLALVYSVSGVVVGYVLSAYVTAVVGAVYVRRKFGQLIPNPASVRTNATQIMRFGAAQLVGGVSAVLLYKTDILLINHLKTATDTASYQAAIIPAEFVWFIPGSVQLVVLQNVAANWSKGDLERINSNLSEAMKWTCLTLILIGIGLFGLAEQFVMVYYGNAYADSAGPLRILLVGTFLFGVARVFVPALQATGWIIYTESVTVIALLINIVLNLLLIPEYGIRGAAFATSLSYGLVLVGGLIIWSRTEMTFGSWSFFGRAFLAATLFGVSYIQVIDLLSLPPVQMLVLCPPIGLVLFAVSATLSGALTRRDYRRIRSVVRSRL